MKNYTTKSIISCFLLLVGLSACDSDSTEGTATFDKSELVSNLTDNLLTPTLANFDSQVSSLLTASGSFNQSPTEAKLLELQNTWKNTIREWKKVEYFNFDVAVIHATQIYFFPTRNNLIENALSDSDEMNTEYVQKLGVSARGLLGMEALIFDSGKSQSEILAQFTTATDSERRKKYIVGIAEVLKSDSKELKESWENYVPTFKANDKAISLFANQALSVLENNLNKRLGEPLGKKSGTDVLPTKVEAYPSQFSKELLQESMEMFQQVFEGGTEKGFDDYLQFVNEVNSNSISVKTVTDQIETSISELGEIENNLQTALSNQKPQVELAYEALKKLDILFRTDIFSALNITVAFTDADGD
ncbi:MAG: putative lipoprotein [Flammeovirgaceae bacterium]|jgi:predicted lipoprotein